ncbi:MAG: lytic transglycosylase domain-containing protein [Alphaproteobacteria bacterium]
MNPVTSALFRKSRDAALVAAVAILLWAPLLSVPGARAADNAGAKAPPAAVLNAKDTILYGQIFGLQKDGKWRAADRRIRELEDRGLMGHVLAQRYLHPTHYRSRFRELRDWMATYADHPDARRIYRLALRRKPAKARAPRRPVSSRVAGAAAKSGGSASAGPVQRRGLSAAQRQRTRSLMAQIRRALRRGRPTSATKILARKETRRLLSASEYDQMRAHIAHSYFSVNKDREALALAEAASARSAQRVSLAPWVAGLAAWRLGETDRARRHFETQAAIDGTSSWTASAGAFWAARANLVTGRPQRVSRFLGVAAKHPHTFYGLLALRMLGKAAPFDWRTPVLTENDLATLRQASRGWRALALLQVGEITRAERELRALDPSRDPALARAMLAVATNADLPALALRLGNRPDTDAGHRDSALYPLPPWVPREGYSVDPALIYAVMRQESGFNARAKSPAGAHGLMQLMPRTATFTSKRERFVGNRRHKLYDPETNVTLGQKYLRYLLDHPRVQGDLFLLAVAYNGGLGNLSKWKRRAVFNDDPLLFIEAIPSRETRIFIERVLANLWIYRQRLNQGTPSLDALAAGEWPAYRSLDGRATEVADDVAN